ncbi:uncharacterized protein N7482_009609 [Penicillium canariense]|uniref:Uncharacterized protein n=1 Tax=Penicillium canariense TaxID=189055 RepID=A0A9W9HP51_9EURO|nr:uncharacterized protein N7482_009609 [Penicillium canariense]KAJ5153131.1 hypothetical protein N7482_009609 [Penicillium canariense]
MRFTSLAAMGLMGCALALPGPHNPPNGLQERATRTRTIDITGPAGITPIPSHQPSDRPIHSSAPSGSAGGGLSGGHASGEDIPESVKKAQQKLVHDLEKGSSAEELQKDVNNIWSAELAEYSSTHAKYTVVPVPQGNAGSEPANPTSSRRPRPAGQRRPSARPKPSGQPTPSAALTFPGGQGGERTATASM